MSTTADRVYARRCRCVVRCCREMRCVAIPKSHGRASVGTGRSDGALERGEEHVARQLVGDRVARAAADVSVDRYEMAVEDHRKAFRVENRVADHGCIGSVGDLNHLARTGRQGSRGRRTQTCRVGEPTRHVRGMSNARCAPTAAAAAPPARLERRRDAVATCREHQPAVTVDHGTQDRVVTRQRDADQLGMLVPQAKLPKLPNIREQGTSRFPTASQRHGLERYDQRAGASARQQSTPVSQNVRPKTTCWVPLHRRLGETLLWAQIGAGPSGRRGRGNPAVRCAVMCRSDAPDTE